MQDNHRLIKDVSNALNYYIDRTRREEGFDLSGILTPAYDLNQFKLKKLFGYSLAYDEQVKKLMQSEYKTPKIGSPKNEDLRLREKFYRDELKYHCKWDRVRKIKSKSPTRQSRPKDYFEASQYEKRNKSIATVPAGIITVRNKNTPHLSKREKMSMLNLTSKIMSATLDSKKPQLACYARKSLAKSRRLERDRHLIEEKERKQREAREKEMERRNNSNDELNPLTDDRDTESRPLTDEFDYIKKTLTNSAQQSANQKENLYAWIDELKLVESGDSITYKILVKTGDRNGSSTEAEIGIVLFGEKGKSRYFALKNSKNHRIPFSRSHTDIFEIETFDIGEIKAIQIGHLESGIEFNWFMEFLRVEDRVNNISYNFVCDDWFGNSSEDKKTSRILLKKNYTHISSEILDPSSRTSSSSSLKSIQKHSSESKAPSRIKSSPSSKEDAINSKNVDDTSSNLPKLDNKPLFSESSTTRSLHPSPRTSNSSSSSSSSSSSATSKTSEKSRKSSPTSSNEEKNVSIHTVKSNPLTMNSIEAVEKNSLEDLKKIVAESPTEINRTDSKGKSLLSIACENGSEEIVKYLVDHNDSLINEENVFGYLPVHFCARYNHLQCLKILFDSGASLQIKNNEGQTPLHLAADSGHIDIVEWLCDHKANLNIMDLNECKAYDLAEKRGHERVANYLASLMGKPLIEFGNRNGELETGRKTRTSSSQNSRSNSSSSSTSSSSSSRSKLSDSENKSRSRANSNAKQKNLSDSDSERPNTQKSKNSRVSSPQSSRSNSSSTSYVTSSSASSTSISSSSSSRSKLSDSENKSRSRANSNAKQKNLSDSDSEKPNSQKKLSLPSIKSPSAREDNLKSKSPPNTPTKAENNLINSFKERLKSNSFSSPSNTARSEKVASPLPSRKSSASLRQEAKSPIKAEKISDNDEKTENSDLAENNFSPLKKIIVEASNAEKIFGNTKKAESPLSSKKSSSSLREEAKSPIRAEKVSSPELSKSNFPSIRRLIKEASQNADRIPTPSKKSSSSRAQSRTSQNLDDKGNFELSRKSSTSSSSSVKSKKERINSGRKSDNSIVNKDNTAAPFEDTKKTIDDLFE